MIKEYKWTIVDVSSDKWVFLYNDETMQLLCHPFQAVGSYTCANTLVVADSQQECHDYIIQHKLIDSTEYKSDDL